MNRPLSIAIVTGSFPKLSETFVLHQIVSLLSAGHDVRVFAFDKPVEAAIHEEVGRFQLLERTTYLKSPRHITSRFSALLRRLTRQSPERFDAIVCHFGTNGEKARLFRAQGCFDGPLAVIFHAADLTVWLREKPPGFYTKLFEEAALLLPISRHWQDLLTELGAPPSKVVVRHMGVDTAALSYQERRIGPQAPLRLMSVARLVEKKGIEYALEALALARPKLGRPFEYYIVGDGPLRQSLEARAQALGLGLGPEVRFVGSLENNRVKELMGSMHALLAPSVTAKNGDKEGIPVALMEAMALGLSVFSTQHSGIPELVRHAETGYCTPERDASALATALVGWANAPETWPAVTARARQLVESEFDARSLTSALVSDLQALAERRDA
ncbi:MAG TPA: glycosyltransferase [Polyangiaceae bacterium]|nr:glycosyltransferase [Polyangiaceae bacterium]